MHYNIYSSQDWHDWPIRVRPLILIMHWKWGSNQNFRLPNKKCYAWVTGPAKSSGKKVTDEVKCNEIILHSECKFADTVFEIQKNHWHLFHVVAYFCIFYNYNQISSLGSLEKAAEEKSIHRTALNARQILTIEIYSYLSFSMSSTKCRIAVRFD